MFSIQIKVGKHAGNKCIAFDVWSDKEKAKINKERVLRVRV